MLSGIAKAGMDVLQFHFSESIFSKLNAWNPKESWKNKWKNGDKSQGERFPGSSTVFVFLTDPWHLLQSVYLNSLFAALYLICTHTPSVWVLLLSRVLFGLSFELSYRYLYIKKS